MVQALRVRVSAVHDADLDAASAGRARSNLDLSARRGRSQSDSEDAADGFCDSRGADASAEEQMLLLLLLLLLLLRRPTAAADAAAQRASRDQRDALRARGAGQPLQRSRERVGHVLAAGRGRRRGGVLCGGRRR